MTTAPLSHVCATCRQPLNIDPQTRAWVHIAGSNPGHSVNPIPRHEIDEQTLTPICDFCNTPNPLETSWIFVADSFELHATDGEHEHVGIDDGQGWGACASCTKLINNNDRKRLAARAATLGEKNGLGSYDHILEHISRSHDIFFLTATGESYPSREYRLP